MLCMLVHNSVKFESRVPFAEATVVERIQKLNCANKRGVICTHPFAKKHNLQQKFSNVHLVTCALLISGCF